MSKKIETRDGVICALPAEFFGYFGWPSIARLDDGMLVVVASGFRNEHVCPFGRTVMCLSRDDGSTWASPAVVYDSPLDDRDAGVVNLGGGALLVSWFTSDHRQYLTDDNLAQRDEMTRSRWKSGIARVTDANAGRCQGSWVRASRDAGETWQAPVRVPISAPHGPIRLASGDLLYLGKEFGEGMSKFRSGAGCIAAMASRDHGATWQELGEVPIFPGTELANYHEPHAVELPSGKLIGMIRIEEFNIGGLLESLGLLPFSIMQTESIDGGRTWSEARPLGFHGSPPHLLRHSSGALVMSYGYRQEPYGQRIAISRDEGASWEHDLVLRDDGPDWDLGYPASVELSDGSILTIYYQKPGRPEDKCALLYSQWELPGLRPLPSG